MTPVLAYRIVLSALAATTLALTAREGVAKEQEFRFERADAQSVALVGEFNQWHAQQMSKLADGSWRLTIKLAPGTYGYKFLVNGSEWVFDPSNSNRKTVNGIENSAIEIGSSDATSYLFDGCVIGRPGKRGFHISPSQPTQASARPPQLCRIRRPFSRRHQESYLQRK